MWMWIAAGVGGATVLLVLLMVLAARRRRRNTLVSIVMLSPVPREVTESMVRGIARKVLAGDLEVALLPVPTDAPLLGFAIATANHGTFFVINAKKPYCEDPETESLRFEDERARRAFADHKAWVSVDLSGGMPDAARRDAAIRAMALLAAELIDDSCSLLFAPALGRVAVPDGNVEAALRSADPMSIFANVDVNMPVVMAKQGTPAIDRAIAVARSRWPEFVSIVERQGARAEAMVKGRFVEDENAEFMWIKASSVSSVCVTGELVNAPTFVKSVRKGQTVTIQFDQVVDWICLENGKPKGGFVERVLRNS